MATVAVFEPHPEVRDLLVRVVRRLGHEPLTADARPAEGRRVDAVLLEPADEASVEAVARLASTRDVAVVCVSIYPPSQRVRELAPVAYLEKPFSLADLERAMQLALEARRPRAGRP